MVYFVEFHNTHYSFDFLILNLQNSPNRNSDGQDLLNTPNDTES